MLKKTMTAKRHKKRPKKPLKSDAGTQRNCKETQKVVTFTHKKYLGRCKFQMSFKI